MYCQERETVRWTEKLKKMGSRALGDNSRGDCEVDKRVVVTDVSNIKVIEGMAETTSETPIKVISSDIRTLRNRNNNGGRMIRVFRHTLWCRSLSDHHFMTAAKLGWWLVLGAKSLFCRVSGTGGTYL